MINKDFQGKKLYYYKVSWAIRMKGQAQGEKEYC